MKIRNDFVSNSSSCSFIINDPIKFRDIVSKWANNDFYDMNNLRAYIDCKLEDKQIFKDKYCKNDPFDWVYDGKFRFNIDINTLFSMPDDEFSKIVSIELMCDDYETYDVFLLSVLKKALEKSGISVNSGDSEHPLLLEDEENYDGHEFMRNICKAAFGEI